GGLDTGDPIVVQHVETSEMQAFLKVIYSSNWNVKEREDHVLQMLNPEHNRSNVENPALPAVENDNIPKSEECIPQGIHTEENHNYDGKTYTN
ncbi:hypothetical protein GDO81_026966, partial [Engystomops pustulosus]